MMYKLLTLDLDGTTLDSKKNFPAETVDAIKKLRQHGIETALASGRALPELDEYQDAVNSMRFGIMTSGAIIYDFQHDKALSKHAIPKDSQMEIIKKSLEVDSMVQIITTKNSVVSQSKIDQMVEYNMQVYQPMYQRICYRCDDPLTFAEEHFDDICKINIYHRTLEICMDVLKKIEHLPVKIVVDTSAEFGLEITAENITKATGLIDLCEIMHIKLEDTMTFGDNANDVEIFQIAGKSIAVANAIDEIKNLADEVTLSNDENGVLHAIKKFFPEVFE